MTSGEVERIRAEYARRDRAVPGDRYSLADPANLFAYQQRNCKLLRLLRAEGLMPLAGKRILDVGCGEGQQLLDLETWGARRTDLAGIDLLEGRVDRAWLRLGRPGENGGSDVRVGDASHLPWPEEYFDLVFQNTVFTSILEPQMKLAVAREIGRVLRPGGVFVWYDFLFNNPANPNVNGIGARELRWLFPRYPIGLSRITLAPPIARRLVPVTWIGSLMLEKLGAFNTHYLAVIRKPSRD